MFSVKIYPKHRKQQNDKFDKKVLPVELLVVVLISIKVNIFFYDHYCWILCFVEGFFLINLEKCFFYRNLFSQFDF